MVGREEKNKGGEKWKNKYCGREKGGSLEASALKKKSEELKTSAGEKNRRRIAKKGYEEGGRFGSRREGEN